MSRNWTSVTYVFQVHVPAIGLQFQTNSTGSSLQLEPVSRVYAVVGKSRTSSFSIPSLSYTNSLLSSFVVVDWDPHFVTFTTLTRSVPFNPLLIAVWRMFSNLFWCWETWDWGTESSTSYLTILSMVLPFLICLLFRTNFLFQVFREKGSSRGNILSNDFNLFPFL